MLKTALGQSVKAVYSGVVGFLGSLVVVMVGDTGFGDITDGQWVAAVLLGLTSAGGVYGLRNGPPSTGGSP